MDALAGPALERPRREKPELKLKIVVALGKWKKNLESSAPKTCVIWANESSIDRQSVILVERFHRRGERESPSPRCEKLSSSVQYSL